MARKLRFEYPDALYRVMFRGKANQLVEAPHCSHGAVSLCRPAQNAKSAFPFWMFFHAARGFIRTALHGGRAPWLQCGAFRAALFAFVIVGLGNTPLQGRQESGGFSEKPSVTKQSFFIKKSEFMPPASVDPFFPLIEQLTEEEGIAVAFYLPKVIRTSSYPTNIRITVTKSFGLYKQNGEVIKFLHDLDCDGNIPHHNLPKDPVNELRAVFSNVLKRLHSNQNEKAVSGDGPFYMTKSDLTFLSNNQFSTSIGKDELMAVYNCLLTVENNTPTNYLHRYSYNMNSYLGYRFEDIVDEKGIAFRFSPDGKLFYDYYVSPEQEVLLQNVVTNLIAGLNRELNKKVLESESKLVLSKFDFNVNTPLAIWGKPEEPIQDEERETILFCLSKAQKKEITSKPFEIAVIPDIRYLLNAPFDDAGLRFCFNSDGIMINDYSLPPEHDFVLRSVIKNIIARLNERQNTENTGKSK